MSESIASDQNVLRDDLVDLAMLAIVNAHEENRSGGVLTEQLRRHLGERMAAVAQTIVAELESAANNRPLAGELTLRQTEAWLASRGLCALSPVFTGNRWTVTAMINVGPCLSVFSANGAPVIGEGRDLQDSVTNLMSRIDAARAA